MALKFLRSLSLEFILWNKVTIWQKIELSKNLRQTGRIDDEMNQISKIDRCDGRDEHAFQKFEKYHLEMNINC